MAAEPPVLFWGIKESFRAYLDLLPDGEIESRDGSTQAADGAFEFTPIEKDARQFRGATTLSGHGGDMRVELIDPRLEESDGNWFVSILRGGDHVRVASLAHRPTPGDAGGVATALTAEGAQWLGGFYASGEDLDPIGLRRPSGEHRAG